MTTSSIAANLIPASIESEMRTAYLDYAMSVIVARALPDVRDGLKPVHRRILYAMHAMGLRHNKPHRKSARIVGEVLGKFHPHGDSAVYDAMVRMAQDFSMRYPLVDGQGNFGSIDGDNAAAMRYTEARLTELAETLLLDLDKETVDFRPNFDESLNEPAVLPAALPNLLLNGSSGIAVGMATNIPPHNLGEVVDALAFIIDHYHAVDEITLPHLLQFIKGPDFPTGGIAYRYREARDGSHDDILARAYSTGRGRLRVQAKVHVEAMSRNRNRLIITELPYQTNKTRLIERIADLVRNGRIEGITDLRDESDRQGMRVVIELTRNVEPEKVLAVLYKNTPLQQTFGINMLALVKGEPRVLSLKRMLLLYLEHRQEIVRRRSEYELARARDRAHILEGLLIALKYLDEVIATIRRSSDTETARTRLMKKFKLSERQAQAILDMPLKRLAKLERDKLAQEYKELKARIRYLEDLLAHPAKMLAVIKAELLALKEQFGDVRRTRIVDIKGSALTTGELMSEEPELVMLTKKGLLFRQSLAGRRRGSLPRRSADVPLLMVVAPPQDTLFLFTAAGQVIQKPMHQIPDDEGQTYRDLTGLSKDDEIIAMVALPRPEGDAPASQSIFLVSREGRSKRIGLDDLWNSAHASPLVMKLEEDDALLAAQLCQPDDEIMLFTRMGQSIRFTQKDVRVMGLPAAGVQAMKLTTGDEIVAAAMARPGAQVLILTTHGFGLRTPVEKFPTQKRYGAGVLAMRFGANHGAVADAVVVSASHELFAVMHRGAMKVLRLEDFSVGNRASRGRQLVSLKEGQVRKLLALVIPKVKGDEGVTTPPPPPPPPAPRVPARRATATKKRSSTRKQTATQATSSKSARPAAKRTRKAASGPAATRTTSAASSKTASRAATRTTSAAPSKTASRAATPSKPASRPRKAARPPVQEPLLTPDPRTPARKTSLIDTTPPAKPATKPAKSTRRRGSKPKATKAKPSSSLDAIKKRVKKK
jgi:DNA gyrase subunit A